MPAGQSVNVHLFGGLGNKLFQVCAGLELARRRGCPITLWASRATRPELAALLRLDVSLIGSEEQVAWRVGLPTGTRLVPVRLRLMGTRRPTAIWLEDTRYFEPPSDDFLRLTDTEEPVFLHGFFQHLDYVGDFPDLLADRMLPQLDLGVRGDVRVHLRRGDYVTLGWHLPDSFYHDALRDMGVAADDSRIEIVSNDPLAARGLVEILRDEGWQAQVLDCKDALGDLAALANSERLVIANSTFSWWAGKLGDRLSSSHRVAFPDQWIPNAPRPHLAPDTWKRVGGTAADGGPTG